MTYLEQYAPGFVLDVLDICDAIAAEGDAS